MQLAVDGRGRPGPRPGRGAPARPSLLLRAGRGRAARRREAPARAGPPRILVAGIGNVFLGDDGFGVEVAGRLAPRELPPGVEVADFGIRGMDLAYALQDGYDAAVLLDALPRGERAGHALPDRAGRSTTASARSTPTGWTRSRCSRSRARSASPLPRVLVVGCEPRDADDARTTRCRAELSEPVRAALDEAVRTRRVAARRPRAPTDRRRKESRMSEVISRWSLGSARR